MEANSGARLMKLLVFSWLFYVTSASTGYLFVNISRPPHCYSLPSNNVCPQNLVNYKVADFDSGLGLANKALQAVDITVSTLDFFTTTVSDACRNSVREYACSNIFPVCTENAQGTVIGMQYNVTRTTQACAAAAANCPAAAQPSTIFNCSLIMSDASEFLTCGSLPDVPGDACKKTNYKYSKVAVRTYPYIATVFKTALPMIQVLITNTSCYNDYVDIACQLNKEAICSTDQKLRMFTMSQQECSHHMQCLPTLLKGYVQKMCNLFPSNTAKKVPLPSVVNSNVASGK